MNELIRVAADVQGFCESRCWRFCLIGGLALQRWGEPRETVDVDLTLLTGFGGEDPFIHACSIGPLAALKEEPDILTDLARRRAELDR